MSDDARSRAADHLRRHHVMTLATAGPRGPWAAAVFYVADGFRLHFVSSPSSRHATDLAADPRAAATVQGQETDWRRIRGVQLEGLVAEVPAHDRPRVRALYAARFPAVAAAPELAAALAEVRWYVLTPAALHLVDNAAGLGRRTRVL